MHTRTSSLHHAGRSALVALLILYVAGVLAVTLTPTSGSGDGIPEQLLCLACGSRGVADAVLNLILFVPLGVLPGSILEQRSRFGLRNPSQGTGADFGFAGKIVMAGCLFSLAIESVQLWIPGRHPTTGDLVFNTAGVAFGAFVVGPALRRAAVDVAFRRVLALVWVAGVLLWWILGSVWFQPTVPGGVLYGQWTPDLGGYEAYDGRVLSASVGGIPLPSRRAPDQEALRRQLQAGSSLRLRFVAGVATNDLAPILNIFDDHGRPAFVLGARGDDLVFIPRLRADDHRLDRPDLDIRGALTDVAPGDTVAVEVRGPDDGMYRFRVDGAESAGGFTLGRTWALLLFAGGGSPMPESLIDALWLVFLGLPLGLLAFGVGRMTPFTAVLALSGGLAVIPVVSSLVPTPGWHYAALLGGVLLGSGYCLVRATISSSRSV